MNRNPRHSLAGPEAETELDGVRLSHPGKVLYPVQGLTKLDLARHYQRVAGLLLPHVRGRPLVLLRCPSGARSKCFIQRHAGRSRRPDAIQAITVMNEGKAERHLAVDDPAGVIALAQFGVLEVHAWGSWPGDPDTPDRITFDLDPGEGTEWTDLVEAASRLRDVLSACGLNPFVKTTGGRGLHVVVPLDRGASWDAVQDFSRSVAQSLAEEAPERYTATMGKARRAGKIYIDYLRNARAASAVAPYSPRGREGAPVAVPLAWEELGPKVRSNSFNVRNLPARLKRRTRDPWEGFEQARRPL